MCKTYFFLLRDIFMIFFFQYLKAILNSYVGYILYTIYYIINYYYTLGAYFNLRNMHNIPYNIREYITILCVTKVVGILR